jgi:hypothetical protein
MTDDLTPDERDALIEALENGYVRLPDDETRWTLLGTPLVYRKRGRESDLYELTQPARLLAQSLKREREAKAWRPIETAPRDGTEVLMWWPYWSKHPERGAFKSGRWETMAALSAMDDDIGPTHWLPIPSPPESGE